MAEYTIDKFTYGGNTYNLDGWGVFEYGDTYGEVLDAYLKHNGKILCLYHDGETKFLLPLVNVIDLQALDFEIPENNAWNFIFSATIGNYTITCLLNGDGDSGSAIWTDESLHIGTVTSVRVQATSPVQSSTSTAQTNSLNTTISLANEYGDTKNPYGTKTANYVLAAPNGTNGVPSFRALVAADIPDLSGTYSTIQNLVDGTATGSIRQINATDSTSYPLGVFAAAFGSDTKATGYASFAEGYLGEATGNYSHAEGRNTSATGNNSHAEGWNTLASGDNSHVEGYYTTAQRKSQTAIGEYNVLDTTGTTSTRGDYAFIIGNGTSTSARSNALTVGWDGTLTSSGDIIDSTGEVLTNNGILNGGMNLDSSSNPSGLWLNWQGDRLDTAQPIYNLGTNLTTGRQDLTYSADNGSTWTNTGHFYVPFNKLYPVGSVYTTSTATNPSDLGVPGTWEIYDKQYEYHWISNAFSWNSTNTQSTQTAVVILAGRTIEIRLAWNNKVAASDSDITIGTLDVSSFLTSTSQMHAMYMPVLADGLNAIGICSSNAPSSGTTVTFTIHDWVTRATSYPTTLNQPCWINHTFNVQSITAMQNSMCNIFRWKRTA